MSRRSGNGSFRRCSLLVDARQHREEERDHRGKQGGVRGWCGDWKAPRGVGEEEEGSSMGDSRGLFVRVGRISRRAGGGGNEDEAARVGAGRGGGSLWRNGERDEDRTSEGGDGFSVRFSWVS
ncbi:uncharacterized protein A4U43_C07F10530 [Asparagus officinalis]|uniref:Uncharacterized protein n=1 Tax=Asparagus officinalis TaxID=4686 RepID=A0A5P1EAY2_ASPOF|nr:uncharacterized protein A4U43_C07F10530 [Asparagus officinalis]